MKKKNFVSYTSHNLHECINTRISYLSSYAIHCNMDSCLARNSKKSRKTKINGHKKSKGIWRKMWQWETVNGYLFFLILIVGISVLCQKYKHVWMNNKVNTNVKNGYKMEKNRLVRIAHLCSLLLFISLWNIIWNLLSCLRKWHSNKRWT